MIGGPIIDATHAYKPVIIIGNAVIILGTLWLTLTLEFMHKNMYLICSIAGIVGLGAAGIPAILEVTVFSFKLTLQQLI